MLKTLEDVSSTKKRLRIEIPPEAFERNIDDGLQSLKAKARVPGFRPGNAPVSLLEKRFGREVEAEAFEKTVNEAYKSVLKDAGIRPVSAPVFEETGDFKRHAPLNMTILVEVLPKLDDVKYEGVSVKDIPVVVEDWDIEETLKRLQEQKAVFEPSDEPVGPGDLVVIDYSTDVDGKESKDQVIRVGDEGVPEEFSNGLIGMRKDEEKAIAVSYPETYANKEFAGKQLTFKVGLKDVKKVDLPAVDDELAKDVGFESLDALKKDLGEKILNSKKATVKNILKAEALKGVLAAHEFEAPESLVDAEIENLLAGVKARGGKMKDEDLRPALMEPALRNVRAALLLQAIAEKEGIGVTEEDLKAKIQALSVGMRLAPENVIKYYVAKDGSLEGLSRQILEDRALDLLLEKSVIEKGE